MVLSSWKAPLDMDDYSHMDVLSLKLRRLKGSVKDWERVKNLERNQQILEINEGILDILLEDSGIISASNVAKLKIFRKGRVNIGPMRLLLRG